jgi:hypothetical protein
MVESEVRESREVILKEKVKELFNTYFNYVEESDGGYLFHPIAVGCCRVMKMEALGKLLTEIRELSGANPDPLERK